jgi:dipeptidyl aminopeptidase/acylaminoacyl peptidase
MALLYRTCKSPEYVRPLMREYIGGTPAEFPERYHTLSPLSHIDAMDPPTITSLGTSDRLVTVDHATLLNQARSKAGVPHEMYLTFPLDNRPSDSRGFQADIP